MIAKTHYMKKKDIICIDYQNCHLNLEKELHL